MPRYRVDACTEQRYITTIDACSEDDARSKMIDLIRDGNAKPLICGFTKIDVTPKDTRSL